MPTNLAKWVVQADKHTHTLVLCCPTSVGRRLTQASPNYVIAYKLTARLNHRLFHTIAYLASMALFKPSFPTGLYMQDKE